MNLTILKGTMVRDIEIKQAGQTQVGNFCLAVKRTFAKDGQQDTDFINCVAFGKTVELIQKFVPKGNQLIVQGELNIDQYKDKDGQNRNFTKVKVDKIEFCGNKNSSSSNTNNQVSQDGFMNTPTGVESELPFA